jgi:hypothetical protein
LHLSFKSVSKLTVKYRSAKAYAKGKLIANLFSSSIAKKQ